MKNTLRRALRTFIQTIVGYIAVNICILDFSQSKEVIKSSFVGLIISAISAAVAAVMNLNDSQELGSGCMSMDYWVTKYLGSGIDYDFAYGVQCVDLVKHFIDKVLGIKPQSIGNAIEYYNKRNKSTYLTKNFTWINNTPEFIPQKGDICVFTSKSGNGHVSIATGKGTVNYFYSYDQNYPHGDHEPMTEVKHTYDRFLGVLRPKDQSNINVLKVTYFKKCNSKYNSIVDALESIGANSSYKYRKSIASINSIKNYTGTSNQNQAMLTLLKNGTLIKP